jgi:hypothetical protein
MEDDDKFTITLDDYVSDDTITINLNDTHGTSTTYWAGDSVTDVVYHGSNDGTFTVDTSTSGTIDIGEWTLSGDFGPIDNKINPDKVEKMCKHYPGLEKVWHNFKSVYEMCKQDYEGKIKAGEIDEFDDDVPF